MDLKDGVPLMAVAVSVFTLVYTMMKRVGDDYLRGLEKRLEAVEEEAARCVAERNALQRQNTDLLLRLTLGQSRGEQL